MGSGAGTSTSGGYGSGSSSRDDKDNRDDYTSSEPKGDSGIGRAMQKAGETFHIGGLEQKGRAKREDAGYDDSNDY